MHSHSERVPTLSSGLTPSRTADVSPVRSPLIEYARIAARELFGPVSSRNFAVRYWDGTLDDAPSGSPRDFTLVFRTPAVMRRMFLPPSQLAIGEAFVDGDFEVEGDLQSAAALGESLRQRLSIAQVMRLAKALLALPPDNASGAERERRSLLPHFSRRHSRRRDSAAVRAHYDLGNDFYALWLDSKMVYSCAYFESGSEDIDTAQTAKLDLICRKLRLAPGQRLLDIGCGWGALIRHAAAHYGARALGITLSAPQADLATQRIREAGLSDRCTIQVRDYRSLPDEAAFDKVVSVGMVEHVGRSHLGAYFAKAFRVLAPGGVLLNHGIVDGPGPSLTNPHRPIRRFLERMVWRRGAFIDRHVFPDSELAPVGQVVSCAEAAGFEVRDVESLREHYILTVRRWLQRLEEAERDAAALVGARTVRVWRLYMAGCAQSFASHRMGLVQALMAKPDSRGEVRLPLTRSDWYAHAR